jgi:hypothetical protein
MTYTDGTIYTGTFNNSHREGYGTLFFHNGFYEGSWHDDKRHGVGRLIYHCDGNNSHSYTGHFLDDKKAGGLFNGFFD